MILKFAKEISWTKHAQAKMRFYGLSEQRVRRVLNSPKRTEEGIAPNTVAMMQPASIKTKDGKQTWSQEIWVMVQKIQKSKCKNQNDNVKIKNVGNLKTTAKIKIISAWRYPGLTKPGEPLPEEILREMRNTIPNLTD